jgi:adenosylcobinamide-GDP ribazoletransferase
MKGLLFDLLTAVQFLTRIPLPSIPWDEGSLARSVKFFPLAGALIGALAAALHALLAPHLPRLLSALLVLTFLILLTGAFHEDGLADCADAFGCTHSPDRILTIMRDSRIGTYGGTALVLSLLARLLLLASLPLPAVAPYLISAHILCRWTTLPLSRFLPAARPAAEGPAAGGQAVRIAALTSTSTLVFATLFTFAAVALLLRTRALAPILSAILLTFLSGLYYKRRLAGVTGDCFGATNQLAEIGVLLCGVWTP